MASSKGQEGEPLLSVVIPVFNEIGTIDRILAEVQAVDVDLEIIVVDDGSRDGTRERLQELAASGGPLRVLLHERNQGKGAALRTGFAAATGRFVVVQDADLEYDPSELGKLLTPLLDGSADVVYGSRFLNGSVRTGPATSPYRWANRALTSLSNKCTGLALTDMETCYKVFPREIIQAIDLQESRFGFEPEITAKLANFRHKGAPLRFREIPISYRRRSVTEGKKLGWKDGVRAVWCILKYSWK